MGRGCGCGGQTCACSLEVGAGLTKDGAGTPEAPWVIGLDGSTSGTSGGAPGGVWQSGDLKETVRTDAIAGWLDADGSAVSRSSYADLFAAIGTTYGKGNGTDTFNLPDFRAVFRVGVGPGFALGAAGGDNQIQLTVANLPAHGHNMTHSHSIDHDHGSFTTIETGGGHQHDGAGVNLPRTTDADGASNTGNAGDDDTGNAGAGNAAHHHSQPVHKHTTPDHTHPLPQAAASDTWNGVVTKGVGAILQKLAQITRGDGGQHQHTINVPAYSGSSGGSTRSTSANVGSGAAFTNLPPYRSARVLIKT